MNETYGIRCLKLQKVKCVLCSPKSNSVFTVAMRFHTQSGTEPPVKTSVHIRYKSLSATACIFKHKYIDKRPVTEAHMYEILADFVRSPRKYTRHDARIVVAQKIHSAQNSAGLIFELMTLLM